MFSRYMRRLGELQSAHPDWRPGQTAFNALSEFDSELQNEVAGTGIDPFYLDERLPEFFAHVHDVWCKKADKLVAHHYLVTGPDDVIAE